MEEIETRTKEFTEEDGTKMIETLTIRRIKKVTKKECKKEVKKIVKEKTEKKSDEETEKNSDEETEENSDEETEENSDEETEEFTVWEKEALDRHNHYRSKHGCPKLILDRDICEYAQEWANRLARQNSMQHRSNNKYGENIYMMGGYGCDITVDGKDPVDAWYNEIKHYNFNYPGFSSGTGHFTQVVWRNSKRLGIAKAKNAGAVYVVANYDPPGNYQGRFPENVPPPK